MHAHDSLYQTQNTALECLLTLPSLKSVKLCGGTAIAQCYLNHRLSYDLDFFLPTDFSPLTLSQELKKLGLKTRPTAMTEDPQKANQWHGFIDFKGQSLKVSFVEDAYFDVYPIEYVSVGSVTVPTESLEGLYHRKLLTISHPNSHGVSIGGRQTARDLFDLWVLSQHHSKIPDFIQTLPYDYPIECFEDGLQNMPWFDLIPEFKELVVFNEQWKKGQDVEEVRTYLYQQLNLPTSLDESFDFDPPSSSFKSPSP